MTFCSFEYIEKLGQYYLAIFSSHFFLFLFVFLSQISFYVVHVEALIKSALTMSKCLILYRKLLSFFGFNHSLPCFLSLSLSLAQKYNILEPL